MKQSRRKQASEATAADPGVVAIARPSAGGFAVSAFRVRSGSVEVLASTACGASGAPIGPWIDSHRAARTVVVLPSADVIVRAVQLPSADERRLEGALQLNASTFVLGRTPSWRVASALLPRERGEAVRTGLVAEWPEEAGTGALPPGVAEGTGVTFAAATAGIAALAAATDHPLVFVDAGEGVIGVCVPTSRGLLVRATRAGAVAGAVPASAIAQAVGEACVHAGVPSAEIPAAIARTSEAAAAVLGGGLGFCADDLPRLETLREGGDRSAAWWHEHGIDIGLALAALGPLAALTRLQSRDIGAKPDRAGAFINRMSEPRTARRLLVAGLAAVLLGPLAIEGLRLLVLRWKMPDLAAYIKAEDEDRRRQAMYRVLSRQGASMTKTLSDLACTAPDGIEIEFINVSQSAKGQAVTVRGKARSAGSQQPTEVMLDFERQMRECGAFESIQRSSEAPDSRGYQAFSLNATAVRPTMMASFPEAQDFAKTSMRERRYGPPPDDVDHAASGLATPDASAKPATDRPATPPARESGTTTTTTTTTTASGTGASDAPAPTGALAPQRTGADSGLQMGAASVVSAAKADAANSATPAAKSATDNAAAATGEAAKPSEGEAAGDAKASARAARGSGSSRSGLATRSNPGATNEPEPLPAPITENEINKMSREEARQALVTVSRARNRADIDDATKVRLKNEFDLLLERCRKE